MEKEWDARAEINAFRYVDGRCKSWDTDNFFNLGEKFVCEEVDPFIKRYIQNPEDKTAVELGCGVGRIVRAFSSRFKYVVGLDVSGKMIEIAKSLHHNLNNVAFFKNDGKTFINIGDDTVDYVFSVVTFQHMPSKDVVETNIKEIARVLNKNGVFQIDFPILQGWVRVFGVLPLPRLLRKYVPDSILRIYRLIRIRDRLKRSETFQGVVLTKKTAQKIFEKYNLKVSFQPNNRTDRKMWAVGYKQKNKKWNWDSIGQKRDFKSQNIL